MSKERWKNIIEAVGIVSIVASLIFVGMEVRQSGRAANDEALVGDTALIIDTQSLVLAHPDVWRRGCAGATLDATEEVIFSQIHFAYVMQYFLRWERENRGLEVASPEMTVDNVAMNIYRYPGFEREWEAQGKLRQHVSDEIALQEWRRLVEQRVSQYPTFEPEPLSDLSRCGLL